MCRGMVGAGGEGAGLRGAAGCELCRSDGLSVFSTAALLGLMLHFLCRAAELCPWSPDCPQAALSDFSSHKRPQPFLEGPHPQLSLLIFSL